VSFRFRRSFSLLPCVRLNLGAAGASVSVGAKGAKVTFGHKGVRATAGIPGSGMFFSKKLVNEPVREKRELELPPAVEEVVRERPPHWEFLLIQRALRSAVEEINCMAAAASAHGTDAITFHKWIAAIPAELKQLLTEWMDLFNNEMRVAFVAGQAGDAEPLLAAMDRLIFLTRTAIRYDQRAAALARHPLYGNLAKPFRGVAQPFVDAYNDLLQRFDEQLSKAEAADELQMHVQLDLKYPESFIDSFTAAQDEFARRFFDSTFVLKTGDVVKERFEIARGEERLGCFSRGAIADNLEHNLFQKDDWFWSDDAQAWQPLGSLLL